MDSYISDERSRGKWPNASHWPLVIEGRLISRGCYQDAVVSQYCIFSFLFLQRFASLWLSFSFQVSLYILWKLSTCLPIFFTGDEIQFCTFTDGEGEVCRGSSCMLDDLCCSQFTVLQRAEVIFSWNNLWKLCKCHWGARMTIRSNSVLEHLFPQGSLFFESFLDV